MKLLTILAISTLAHWHINTFIYAQIGGNNTYEFLNLPVSARVAALGGNLIPVKDDDVALAYLNPSLLNKQMDGQLTMNMGVYFAGINYGYLGYVKHKEKVGTFGTGIQYISYGKFQRADANGELMGNFYAKEFAFHFSWAQNIEPFSYGANFKLITSFLETYFSFGLAIDIAGTYYNKEKEFTAALILKNIGGQIVGYVPGTSEPMPFEIQLGVSKRLEHLPFRFSVIAHNLQKFNIRYDDPNQLTTSTLFDTDSANVKEKKYIADKIFRHFIFGGEFLLGENFMLRLGYNHLRRQELKIDPRSGLVGFSWGVGVKIKKLNISYARATYSLAGAANHISISTNLAAFMGQF